MQLADVAATSSGVAATRSRLTKVELLAGCLGRAAYDEAPVVVSYLSGELRQRRTGVGWAALKDLPPPAGEPSLGVLEVDAAFQAMSEVSGAGSQGARKQLVTDLFGRATAAEQRLLAGLVSGELRQGAMESLVTDAVAKAVGLPLADVRRAVMLCGALGPVAEAALREGAAGLAAFRLEVGRPLKPMLASPAASMDEALDKVCPAAVEWKLDGIRVQVHRDGDDVRVFTRSLDDITARVPELVSAVLALPLTRAVLDGEAIALRDDGRPAPFQETGSRAMTQAPGGRALMPWFFDLLHLDGEDLLGQPSVTRFARLAAVVPETMRVPRVEVADADAGRAVFDDALAHGHEGVVVKSLDAPYDAGRRGSAWLKVKPRHTLDLVVIGVEWGHGRRKGWLSNLHLGARDPDNGGFVMLGKTFKGLTDELLAWQTERFLELEESRNEWQVFLRPEQVVEIAFDGVQTSPRYPGGVALRFARVLRYRDDKSADEADTIDTVRALRS